MAVPHDAPAAIVGLQFGGRGQKLGHFRFDRLGQEGARPIAQDFRQPIDQSSWLNQFENVIVRHGISLLRWRSGGSNTPTICRLPRFTPSPTFSHSSPPRSPILGGGSSPRSWNLGRGQSSSVALPFFWGLSISRQ